MTDTNTPRTDDEILAAALRKSVTVVCDPTQLQRDLSAANAELAAVRELMNIYNLGGWTDAIGPMQRALAAEAKLSAANEHAKRIIVERDEAREELARVTLLNDGHQRLATQYRERAERAEAALDAAMKDAERYRWLRGDAPTHSERWPRWNLQRWDGRCWHSLERGALDAAIDAAREGK